MYRFRRRNYTQTDPLYIPWWRRYTRRIIHALAHILLSLFSRSTITGSENFPKRGPYIVAGNHRGIMEVALMLAAVPVPIEIIGAGDIPLDRRYRYFAHWYGFIPYHRGLLDREALRTARRVLDAGGVVGIFPEGGIWKRSRKGVQRGVAWLSFKTGAEVIPIGFGGVAEGVHRAITLQHPVFEAHIGEKVERSVDEERRSPRQAMERYSDRVMERIDALVPSWDEDLHRPPVWETYELHVYLRGGTVTAHDGSDQPRGGSRRSTKRDQTGVRIDHELYRPDRIALFFHLPVLLNTLYFNLKRRSVLPLRRPGRWTEAERLRRAVAIVIGYSTKTNPAYLSYRLGSSTAAELFQALVSFYRLLARAADDGAEVRFVPVKRVQWYERAPVEEITRPVFTQRL